MAFVLQKKKGAEGLLVDWMRPAIMGDRTQCPSLPSKGHQPPQIACVISPLSATFCQFTWLSAHG